MDGLPFVWSLAELLGLTHNHVPYCIPPLTQLQPLALQIC